MKETRILSSFLFQKVVSYNLLFSLNDTQENAWLSIPLCYLLLVLQS